MATGKYSIEVRGAGSLIERVI